MKILGVGIATLDIINRVTSYPVEDSEVRALSQRRARGGNVTNTLSVLSALGHQCHWAGVLPHEPDTAFVEDALQRAGINLTHVQYLPSGKLPTSYVTISAETGSRTIVHMRDMPEFQHSWFRAIHPEDFDWIHFEARETEQLRLMLADCETANTMISLEVEKPRERIEELFDAVDVLLFSRHYAQSVGFTSAEALLQHTAQCCRQQLTSKRPLMICAWGEQGGWALGPNDELMHQPATPIDPVIDTLGAGDVFNAAIIHVLGSGESLKQALAQACEMAAKKCMVEGLENFL